MALGQFPVYCVRQHILLYTSWSPIPALLHFLDTEQTMHFLTRATQKASSQLHDYNPVYPM